MRRGRKSSHALAPTVAVPSQHAKGLWRFQQCPCRKPGRNTTPGVCKIRCHIPRIPHKPLAKWGQNFRYISLDLDISTPQAISISNPNAPDQSPCAQHLRELKVGWKRYVGMFKKENILSKLSKRFILSEGIVGRCGVFPSKFPGYWMLLDVTLHCGKPEPRSTVHSPASATMPTKTSCDLGRYQINCFCGGQSRSIKQHSDV